MRKGTISPEAVKILSTLTVAIIFMIIVLSFSNFYTKSLLKKAENEYFDSIEAILDGYSSIVSIQLQNYKESLQAFNISEYFDTEDDQIIANFLFRYGYKKNQDFNSIYYINRDGTAFTTSGLAIQINPEKHPCLSTDCEFYIGDLDTHLDAKYFSFCMEEKIYTSSGDFLGVLGASINLENFNQDNLGIKLGSKEGFMLVDRNGVFLLHQRQDVIGKTYTPKDERFIHTSTENIAKAPPGRYFTRADDNNEIYLITSKIPECNWTISIRVSMKELNAVFKPQKHQNIQLIIFSLATIFVLVIVEAWVVNYIQRKQLIATVYDPLTNLFTRQRFESEAKKMVRYNPRSKFMLVEADIRGFKFINQNYGEEIADRVIVYYSKLLTKMVSDFRYIMGRGFADHFYVLIKITSVHKAMKEFKDKMAVLNEELKSYDIPFFPKFGITFLNSRKESDGLTIQTLIGQASFAKSTIKDNMLTQYSVYNSRLLEKINEERFIENHMQQALDSKEFFVMYQPKVSLTTDKIVGAEALVRWNSPTLGLMTPEKFIPLFERNGFITKLDFFVYEEVFKFLQKRLDNGETVVPISVNMSRNHNKPDKFMHDFLDRFYKYSIPPEMIQVEILERSVMDSNTLRDITDKLHKEGFTVAMDDFGSGESSLNMLTKIPVDVLKFDREFLNSSTNSDGKIDDKSAKFIHILINLSKNLDKQTVFEGVETQAQRDFLRSIECDQAQGFFYSKPLSEQDFVQFIKLHS